MTHEQTLYLSLTTDTRLLSESDLTETVQSYRHRVSLTTVVRWCPGNLVTSCVLEQH